MAEEMEIHEAEPSVDQIADYQQQIHDLKGQLEAEILSRDVDNFVRETIEARRKDGFIVDREKLDKVLSRTTMNRDNYQELVAEVVGCVEVKFRVQTPENTQHRAGVGPRILEAGNIDNLTNQLWKDF